MSSLSLPLSPGAWSEHYRGRVQASEAFSRIRFSDQTNETADADAHAPASIESRARAALFGRSFVYVYKEDSGTKDRARIDEAQRQSTQFYQGSGLRRIWTAYRFFPARKHRCSRKRAHERASRLPRRILASTLPRLWIILSTCQKLRHGFGSPI